jgi:drug/metabolite transporter (DMT)-like permease
VKILLFKSINDGVKYMLLASFFFAIMGAFAKILSDTMPPVEVVFFRNIIGVFLVLISLMHSPLKQKGGRPFLLIFRGLMGFLALLAFFYNIAHISLADAMTFSRTSPIFTALFAAWFLRESIGSKGWLAVFAGFLGVVFIMQPNGLSFSKTDLLGIFSGVGAALAYTSVRELKRYYDTRSIVLSFMGVGTIGPIILMAISHFVEVGKFDFILGEFIMPRGIEWLYIAALGVFATLAQGYMTKAYGATKAGIAGAVSYTNILFSLLLGVMLGDNLPNLLGFFGIMLVIFGGILVAKEKG